jgi:hypothetical protein
MAVGQKRGCDQIMRRFEQITGKQARLATTGQSFAAVAEARARDMVTTVAERLPWHRA